jgi:hypothetical protein
MGLDWSLIFQGLKTVLDPLAIASWPIAFVVAAWLFRKPIASVTNRVSQFNGFGTSASFAPIEVQKDQQEPEKISAPAPFENAIQSQLPQVGTDPVFDVLDKSLSDHLEKMIKGDDALKLKWAIRERSISEGNRIHEMNYRLIFGSQISVLKYLNTASQSPLAMVESYYKQSVRANSAWEAMHKDRTFEQWLGFLTNTGYAIREQGLGAPSLHITPFGKHFLTWMVNVGVTELKAG